MPVRYRRHFLKTKEASTILEKASEELKVDFDQIFGGEVEIERVETSLCQLFIIKDRPLLVRIKKRIYPTLVFSKLIDLMPEVVVDMGAVPHICNGADVMAPGIVRYKGELRKGALVRVVDEQHGKTIAIGTANYDAKSAKKTKRGVVVENIHFVGDKIWNLIKKLENPPAPAS